MNSINKLSNYLRSTKHRYQQHRQMIHVKKKLLSSNNLSDKERVLLSDVSLEIHPNDGMCMPVDGGQLHYLSVGLSAIRCIEKVLKKINVEKPILSILDFPCGYGRVSRFLRVRFPHAQITASEIYPEMINFCKSEFSAQAFLSNEDISRLILPKKFDLIWCGSLFTHIDENRAMDLLRFFQSNLSPQGICVFTTHGQLSVDWLQRNITTYGLTEEAKKSLLANFRKCEYGYANYENQPSYGISVVSHEHVLKMAHGAGPWKEIAYLEHAWDNHQDVYGFVNL